jgi:hypothetical protein
MGVLVLHSKFIKKTYDIFWTIEEFPYLMKNFSEDQAVEKRLTAVLPWASEPTAISLKCSPNVLVRGFLFSDWQVKLEVSIGSGGICADLGPNVKIGQLIKDEPPLSWKLISRDGNKLVYSSSKTCDELRNNQEQLLPGDRLMLHIELTNNLPPRLISTTVRPKFQSCSICGNCKMFTNIS